MHLHIDHEHCRAICHEIGDRLSIMLNPEVAELPLRLLRLPGRLAESERGQAPSIVPTMEDTGFWWTVTTRFGSPSHRSGRVCES
jgi:hypothetical protein